MSERKRATRTTWKDPDEAPELTDEFFERADKYVGERLVRRGRGPQKKPTKRLVSLRLSPEVLEYFKATGPGWQTRIDQTLKRAVARARS